MAQIYIYQMGKVGSTSFARAVDGIQVHWLDPESWFYSLRGGRNRHLLASIRMRLCLRPHDKIITAVREPIARNLSAFMQNHRSRGWSPDLETFLAKFRHREPLDWFDREVRRYLGIDVYAHDFDCDLGWQNIDDRLLIVKAEIPDAVKSGAIEQFLGRNISLHRQNIGDNKDYSGDYNKLKNARLPEQYVEEMLGSKYAKHFYSDDQLAKIRQKWLPA